MKSKLDHKTNCFASFNDYLFEILLIFKNTENKGGTYRPIILFFQQLWQWKRLSLGKSEATAEFYQTQLYDVVSGLLLVIYAAIELPFFADSLYCRWSARDGANPRVWENGIQLTQWLWTKIVAKLGENRKKWLL